MGGRDRTEGFLIAGLILLLIIQAGLVVRMIIA